MSTTIILYLAKVSIILIFLFSIYYFLFSKTPNYTHNRIYLLAGLFVAFIIPILPVHHWFGSSPEIIPQTLDFESLLQELPQKKTIVPIVDPIETIEHSTSKNNPSIAEQVWNPVKYAFSLIQFICWVWVVGMIATALKLLINYRSLYNLYHQGREVTNAPGLVKYHPDFTVAASFFNWIFWPTFEYKESQRLILEHELIHKRQYHSLDILMVECMKIILWFLPVIYWWRQAMELNHEYIADSILAKTHQREAYLEMLNPQRFRLNQPLTHHFSSFISKRVNRIRKLIKPRRWLIIFNLPVLLLVGYLFSAAYIPDTLKSLHHDIFITKNDNLYNEFIYYIGDKAVGSLQAAVGWSNYDTKLQKSLFLATSIKLSKNEYFELNGQEISLYYKNNEVEFTKDVTTNSFCHMINGKSDERKPPQQVKVKGTKVHNAFSKNLIEDQEELRDLYIGISLLDTSLRIHLRLKIHLDNRRENSYIEIDGKPYGVSRYFNHCVPQSFDEVIEMPNILYLNGQPKGIQKHHTYVFDNSGYYELANYKNLATQNPIAVYNGLELDIGEMYSFMYFLNTRKNNLVALKEHSLLKLRSSGDELDYLPNFPLTYLIEEKPISINWGKLKHIYYPSSGMTPIGDPNFPDKLSHDDMLDVLKKSPIISQNDQSLGDKVFIDVTHILRQGVPKDYSLIYNSKTGKLEHDKSILRLLKQSLDNGDFIHFKNIRTKYASEDGIDWTVKIGSTNNDPGDRRRLKYHKEEVRSFMLGVM